MKAKVTLVDAVEFKNAAKNAGMDAGMSLTEGDPGLYLDDGSLLGLVKSAVYDVVKVPDLERTLRFIMSDGETDRDRDQINPKGWALKDFRKNPVMLFAHNSWEPPIGKAVKVGVTDGQLVGDFEFTPAEMNAFGDMIFRMFEGGFLRAGSVGFKALKWKWADGEADETRVNGIDFDKQELLEFSAVPVPANPRALIQAHELGIDTKPLAEWCERTLDLDKKLKGLGMNDVEEAWKHVADHPFVIEIDTEAIVPDNAPGIKIKEPEKDGGNTVVVNITKSGDVEVDMRHADDVEPEPEPEPDFRPLLSREEAAVVRHMLEHATPFFSAATQAIASCARDKLFGVLGDLTAKPVTRADGECTAFRDGHKFMDGACACGVANTAEGQLEIDMDDIEFEEEPEPDKSTERFVEITRAADGDE